MDLGFIPLSVEEEADSLVDVPFVVEVDMEKKSKWTLVHSAYGRCSTCGRRCTVTTIFMYCQRLLNRVRIRSIDCGANSRETLLVFVMGQTFLFILALCNGGTTMGWLGASDQGA